MLRLCSLSLGAGADMIVTCALAFAGGFCQIYGAELQLFRSV